MEWRESQPTNQPTRQGHCLYFTRLKVDLVFLPSFPSCPSSFPCPLFAFIVYFYTFVSIQSFSFPSISVYLYSLVSFFTSAFCLVFMPQCLFNPLLFPPFLSVFSPSVLNFILHFSSLSVCLQFFFLSYHPLFYPPSSIYISLLLSFPSLSFHPYILNFFLSLPSILFILSFPIFHILKYFPFTYLPFFLAPSFLNVFLLFIQGPCLPFSLLLPFLSLSTSIPLTFSILSSSSPPSHSSILLCPSNFFPSPRLRLNNIFPHLHSFLMGSLSFGSCLLPSPLHLSPFLLFFYPRSRRSNGGVGGRQTHRKAHAEVK